MSPITALLRDTVVILDLDGTLVDSAPDLAGAMNAVLAAEGLDTLSPAAVRPLVGEGARALLVRGFEANGQMFPEGEAGERLVAAFLAHYAEHLARPPLAATRHLLDDVESVPYRTRIDWLVDLCQTLRQRELERCHELPGARPHALK